MTAALLSGGVASAATPAVTAQAREADAAFLAYAPAPAAGAGALCLVDTGVHANPDTQPGLLASYAIDTSTTDDVDPHGHGTSMAMIAGAAGQGMIGAWPALKIVSVRATDAPPPGQQPSFEFNNYRDGLRTCLRYATQDKIRAVDLALSSQIPPSPDQAQLFATDLATVERQDIAVVAAAGNNPGPVQEPGVEPGVFAVGADTAQPGTLSSTAVGAPCSFTATQGVALYAPGCGLDVADPFSDQPSCCADGTSQASAFTAAVIVALMSYDPTLTYTKAEQLLVSNAAPSGDLDVGAAFRADGLGQVVTAGQANIPAPPAPSGRSGKPAARPYSVTVRSVRWRRGVLHVVLSRLPTHAIARITLEFAHRHPKLLTTRQATSTFLTRRPGRVVVQVFDGRRAISAATTVRL
jgi:hypothetical protein